MIFEKKKIVLCDDPPEDRVISIFAGCLANHDRTHSQRVSMGDPPFYGLPQDVGGGGWVSQSATHCSWHVWIHRDPNIIFFLCFQIHLLSPRTLLPKTLMMKASSLNMSISLSDVLIIRPESSIISVDHTSLAWCSCMTKTSVLDTTPATACVTVVYFSFGSVSDTSAATC